MKTVKIPSTLHEVFGKESTLVEMLLIMFFSVGATCVVFASTKVEWEALAAWRIIVILVLAFDIFAGFIANLTFSTNAFYQASNKARMAFFAIHIQPLIFVFLTDSSRSLGIGLWIYTILAALLVNKLKGYPAQRVIAGALVGLGLIGLVLFSDRITVWLLLVLAFYQLKVIYSFAVDHDAPRTV
ncbi:MAG: hypothetical protein IPM39_28700 [Chloroflexi bacterium]|nr:hypothetical protein [Chloroflexota bacterium]